MDMQTVKETFRKVPCWFKLMHMSPAEMVDFAIKNELQEVAEQLQKEKLVSDYITLEHYVIFLTLLFQWERENVNLAEVPTLFEIIPEEMLEKAKVFSRKALPYSQDIVDTFSDKIDPDFVGFSIEMLHQIPVEKWKKML